tara:strand:+ start:178 stop:1008 length:831 start_codon:yes stop_codon:yes gene_type:complete
MAIVHSATLQGSGKHKIVLDYRIPQHAIHAPMLVFLHGFKGFKDWGHFNLMADWLCNHGIVVLKFNFSMNGTTPEHPVDFADLEAFGHNTISTELADTKRVIDFVEQELEGQYHPGQIYICGHSRGGGTAILAAAQDKRIRKLVTWASISDFEARFSPAQIDLWEKEGVVYIPNSRTNQQMPLYKVLLDDYRANKEQLSIEKAVKSLKIPYMIFHGELDETVSYKEAMQLQKWSGAPLDLIPSANHVFGGKHPYDSEELPRQSHQLLSIMRDFLLD